MSIYYKIYHLIADKDAKTLFVNFVSLSLLQLVNYTLPFITWPYLAKIIGVDMFGVLAFALAVISYFQVFIEFGYDYTAVRDVANKRENIDVVSRIFSTVMTVRCLFMIISFLILLALIFIFPFFRDHKLILLLTFLYIPGFVLFPDWFFQAMEKMKYITILNILSKLLFTVLVFIVIKNKEDFIYQPILLAAGYMLAGLISLYVISKKFHIRYVLPTIKEVMDSIKGSWNMYLNNFFPTLYCSFTVILLRYYGGERAVGIFDAGNRFIEVGRQGTNVISRTFYPFLARRIDKHNLYMKINLFVSLFLCLFYLLMADTLVHWFYTEAFQESVKVIRYLAISPLLFFFSNVFGINYLVLKHKENVYRNIILISSILSFCFSFFLIEEFTIVGAIITLIFARGLMGGLTYLYVFFYRKKMLNQSLELPNEK